jgi:hypothetical protein
MKRIFLVLLVGLFLFDMSAANQWFVREQYSTLTIKRSFQKKSLGQVRVSDQAVITDLMTRIKALPTRGEIMIKMGPVELTELIFEADGVSDEIAFYGKRLKTTDTSFYADSKIDREIFHHVDKLFRKGKQD